MTRIFSSCSKLSLLFTVLLASCGTPAETEEECIADGTTQWICQETSDILVYQANSCGIVSSTTRRCLNADRCITPAAGGDAFCGTSECVADGTTFTVECDEARPNAVVLVDSCGEITSTQETCLGINACVKPDSGDAFCGCALPDPTPPILRCHPEGSASGPAETTLSYVNGCGQFLEEIAVTCLIGERCWYTWNEDGSVNDDAGAHCAASIDPSQSGSPFYAMACDEEIYMHATTKLPLDCRCNRSNAAMQECRPGADAWASNLRLGTGPNIHGINFAKWGGGFILNGELYAPVHYTGGQVADLKPGAIYAIDITTGNRRVVSGSYLDATTGRVDMGSGHTVQGEALPFLNHIKLGDDGMIYGVGSNTLNHVEITRIHPQTGARTLIWRRQSLDDAANVNFPYGQCFDGRVSPNYAGGFQPVQYAERAFALGPNGTFYLGWNNDGVGVVRISADGSECTHVSRWASNNTTQPLPDIGTGVTPQYGTISGMLARNGTIYAVTKEIMLAIDSTTGNRTTFSNAGGIGGIGETNFFVDPSRDVMFACGTDAARKCSVHRMTDGNDAQGLFQIGQTMPVIEGKYPQIQGAKGALDNNNYNGFGAVALDPTDPNILYFVVLSGLIKYEIDTGNSYFLSM